MVNQLPAEPDDLKRLERLVALLATGMERFVAVKNEKSPISLDFTPNVLPNTRNVNEPVKTENE